MRPTLFHIPDPFRGIPIFGWGLALVVLAVGTVAALIWLWRTRRSLAEARGFLPVVLLAGAAILFLLPLLEDNIGLPIRSYGVLMLLGIVGGVGLAAWRAPAARFDPEVIYSLAMWLVLSGLAGARLFHVIEYWKSSYLQPTWGATLAAIVNVPRGGLVVYGSLIAALIVFPVFVWRHRLPGLALCDLVAPSMVLGLALGRIGCLLNGCCFGGPAQIPWAITFPADSLPYKDQREHGQLDDMKLAVGDGGSVVVNEVLSDAARQAGLSDGDKIVSVSGRIEDVPIELDLSAPPSLHVVKGGPPLSADQARWVSVQRKVLAEDPVKAAQNVLRAISYPQVSVKTDDGRILRWQLPLRSRPVHPTQIYSAIDATLICIFLLAYYPYRRRDGEVFALMLTIYPITRFLIEIIRVDEPGQFGTQLSISQWISFGVAIGVAALWVYVLCQPKGRLWATSA